MGRKLKNKQKLLRDNMQKNFKQEMEAPINELVKGRAPDFERGEIGQDLKSKIQSGEIKIM